MRPNLDKGETTRFRYLHRLFRRNDRQAVPGRLEACVVAFASGKGGTGKSFLATNLAVALHQQGLRVAVVDCDFGLGNAHLLFGTNPRMSLQHVLGGRVAIEDVLVQTPYGPGLVAGGSGISSMADLSEQDLLQFGSCLGRLAHFHDVLVLDAAAGLSPQSLLTLLGSQYVVLVTNPEIAALTDAYALIKCLSRQPATPPISVVVNRVMARGQGWPTFERLADVSRRFAGQSVHYGGEVPEDPAVTHRRLGQPPLLVSRPQCETSWAVRNVLRNLEAGGIPFRPRTTDRFGGVEQRVWRTLGRR